MLQKQPLNEISPLQAAKWLKISLLLSMEDMEALLLLLPKWMIPLSGVIEEGKEIISKEEFLSLYQNYLEQIDAEIRRPVINQRLTCAFTEDLSHVRAVPVSGGLLIRVVQPVLQVQPSMIHYSKASGKFIDSTHSQDSFAWGLTFSSPQLIQNPTTRDIQKFSDPYYKALQRWSRQHTVPTSFLVDGTITHFPARISKTRKIPICLPQK